MSLVIGKKLCGIVETVLIDDSAVIRNNSVEPHICEDEVGLFADREVILGVALHVLEQRVIIINIIVYRGYYALYCAEREQIRFAVHKVRRVSRKNQVGKIIPSLIVIGIFNPFRVTAVFFSKGIKTCVYYFILSVVVEIGV